MDKIRSIFVNWHFTRVLQLLFGLLLTGSYFFYQQDGLTLAFGLLILLQAALNVSCITGICGRSAGNIRGGGKVIDPGKLSDLDVNYEEIESTR